MLKRVGCAVVHTHGRPQTDMMVEWIAGSPEQVGWACSNDVVPFDEPKSRSSHTIALLFASRS